VNKTIKSIYGAEWTMEDYTPSAGSFAGVPCVAIAPNGDHFRVFPVAELLDALGAVAKDSSYAELVEQCGQLARERDNAIQLAAEAEKELADARMAAEAEAAGLDEWHKCAEAAEKERDEYKAKGEWLEGEWSAVKANRDHIMKGFQEFKDRAEDAEATIQQVREYVASHLDPHHQASVVAARVAEGVRAILDPVPPFTLPTEAGARFTANVVKADTGSSRTFTTLVGHDAPLYAYETGNGWHTYTAKEVMHDFTDHRLIGADE
jgi:hypothetical protein